MTPGNFSKTSGRLHSRLETPLSHDPTPTRRQNGRSKTAQRSSRAKPGFIKGSTATFGAPFYGMREMGRIMYANSNGDDYCKPEDYDLPEAEKGADDKSEDEDDVKRQINIVLIKRGSAGARFV